MNFRLRLGHKLALSLTLAAMLPVIVAAAVAVHIVLDGLEDGLRDETARQLRVGRSLVLRNVERLGGDAERLASTPSLAQAIAAGDKQVDEILAHEDPHLPSALVQVTDAHGRVMASRAVGGDANRYRDVAIDAGSHPIQDGLEYERRATIVAEHGLLVVHAVAPVVDPSYALEGVVVMTLPLDSDFADGIKGALGSDVLIYVGDQPAMSSFLGPDGARVAGLTAPADVAQGVLAGGIRQGRAVIGGEEFSLGYAPLQDVDAKRVGMFAVAVGRGSLARAKTAAARSLALGAAGAFAFALLVAGLLSRRFTRPIARLHAGALADRARRARSQEPARRPAQGGRDRRRWPSSFTAMTASLRENQERLAARMREIVALHDAGRAVSSVLELDEVLRKIVDSIARVLDTRLAALWLVETLEDGSPDWTPQLRIGAARTRQATADRDRNLDPGDTGSVSGALGDLAASVLHDRFPLRIDRVDGTPLWREACLAAGIDGSLVAVPLERGKQVVGVLVIGRIASASAFSQADEALLATFADQAAAAIENSRLYEEVRAFSEELEEKVHDRTRELTSINMELGRALLELRETQSQLILSERMAGLGALVAGVAHEINSPSAAIRGSVDALADNVRRLARSARELGALPLSDEARQRVLVVSEELAPRLAEKKVGTPADVRRRARVLAARLQAAGVEQAETAARELVEIGADEEMDTLQPLLIAGHAGVLVAYLREYTYLYQNAAAITTAIKQIQRIIGALKSYSHLDQAKVEDADIHEGIENTLAILHHELKYGIQISRRYGRLPKVPVYVDELNQVWTNLIHNAVQALGGKGEVVLETAVDGAQGMVSVKVIDSGPGIPSAVLPRIFEPFFTTKAKGEGTGLGLGIVEKIVDKHGGRVEVESIPGRTCFTVVLPVSGPPARVLADKESEVSIGAASA